MSAFIPSDPEAEAAARRRHEDLERRIELLESYVLSGRDRGDIGDYQLSPVAHGVNIKTAYPDRMIRNGKGFGNHERVMNSIIWAAIMKEPNFGATWGDLIRVLMNSLDFAQHQRALGRELPKK